MEIEKFVNKKSQVLKTAMYEGSRRDRTLAKVQSGSLDVLICSYNTLAADWKKLRKFKSSQSDNAKKKGKFTFSLSTDGLDMEQKSVDLKMKLYCEKEEAFLKVVAFKENSKWVYEELYVLIPTINRRIQLLNTQKLWTKLPT